jgi:hypothetical protein
MSKLFDMGDGNLRTSQRLARTAGLLYLIVGVLGGLAHLYVRARVYVPGDAAATAANVAADAGLVRAGFLADLVQATVFLFLGMTFAQLFHHVHEVVARAMVVIVAVAVAIICLNLVFQFGALLVATEPAYAGSDALVLLLMDLQHYGYLIAQMFFGLWLAPLGYLVLRSGMVPRALGYLLIAGCAGYVLDLFLQFTVPVAGEAISAVTVLPAAVGELGLALWLLVRGVRVPAGNSASGRPLSPAWN